MIYRSLHFAGSARPNTIANELAGAIVRDDIL